MTLKFLKRRKRTKWRTKTMTKNENKDKEEERKTSEAGLGVGGSSIGWNADVLRGRASGAERTESTNTEYTNGTESNTSQEVHLISD